MTNAQGLYFCLAITLIVAVVTSYLVIKRNKDGDFNQGTGRTAAKYSVMAMLMYPMFILLGICIVFLTMLFYSS